MILKSAALTLLVQVVFSALNEPNLGGRESGSGGAHLADSGSGSKGRGSNKPISHKRCNSSDQVNSHGDKINYGQLIFEDDFDELDMKKWRHEITLGGGGNWEFQFYYNNRSSSFVENGKLHLKPVLTSEYLGVTEKDILGANVEIDLRGNAPNFQCTAEKFYGCYRRTADGHIVNPIMSAQLRSHQSFSFKYGKVEVRAKLPKGDWLWPAIWLLPTHHAYGNWPASGEIDLLESRGNGADYGPGGVDTVSSALHWGPGSSYNRYELTQGSFKLKDNTTFADDFHTFTLEWSPTYIRTMVDNKHKVLEVNFGNQSFWDRGGFESKRLANPWKGRPNIAPFDQEFYLILNLAVGGVVGYFPDDPDIDKASPKKKPWDDRSGSASKEFLMGREKWYPTWTDKDGNDDQSAFVIDYIRVYSLE